MKRVLALALAALLVGCGAAGRPEAEPPVISAGNLLLSPLQVPIAGVRVKLQASPQLGTSCRPQASNCNNFLVPVRLLSLSGPLPALRVMGVYVITEGGVWRSGVAAADIWRCPQRCLMAAARGNADISGGEAVQVVVSVEDTQGRRYLLRDQRAVVSQVTAQLP